MSPWRRQMAECDRSIGRGAFAQGDEDGNCGQLALLPRQQVALEDVAEQVFVQVPINDGGQRRHSPSWAHRRGRRSAFRAAPRAGVLVAAVADAATRRAPQCRRCPALCARRALAWGGCKPRKLRGSRSRHRRAPSLPWPRSQSSPPSSPRARAVLRCSRAPVAAEAAMATMRCWRRLSVSASAARRGAHRADNMMAASGDSQSHKSVLLFVISLLAKIRRSPLSAHTQITEGCTKNNEWLAQRIKTEEAPGGGVGAFFRDACTNAPAWRSGAGQAPFRLAMRTAGRQAAHCSSLQRGSGSCP